MKLKGKNVLVTGAGGFIGSHLVEELLKSGCKVKALVKYNSRNFWGWMEEIYADINNRKNLEIIPGDITDAVMVKKALEGCDAVFHLAALIAIPYSYSAPYSYVDVNVKGTLNVLQAGLECRVKKIVHTSTSEVYGSALYTPMDENHPLQAQSPYAATKIAGDKLAESFFNSFDLPVAIIRPYNTFGPRQSARAVIPATITQALKSDVIRLGSISPVRDFNYVKNTVNAFIAIAESDKTAGEVINFGSGIGITVEEVIGKIGKLMGKKIKVETDEKRIRPDKSEVLQLICDSSKAKRFLNWEPKYSLEQGLSETIEWIKNNQDKYKTEIYNV